MDKNEAQKKEDLLLDLYKIHAYIPNDAQDNPLTPFGNFCAGFEAAQQQSAGEIAELKADNERLKRLLGRAHRELLSVLDSTNNDKPHFDGDDFHELIKEIEVDK